MIILKMKLLTKAKWYSGKALMYDLKRDMRKLDEVLDKAVRYEMAREALSAK